MIVSHDPPLSLAQLRALGSPGPPQGVYVDMDSDGYGSSSPAGSAGINVCDLLK